MASEKTYVSKRKTPQPTTSSKKEKRLPTFAEMQVATLKLSKRLQQKYTDLTLQTCKNVVTYVKQLPTGPWSEHIDDVIFQAQMFQHFNITNVPLLERMLSVAAQSDRNPKLNIEQYADLICLFITSKQKPKTDFAFSVYDLSGKGYITRADVRRNVHPMLRCLDEVLMDPYDEESLNFMTTKLMTVMDFDKNEHIDREEFHRLVSKFSLMRECLGPCLPDENFLQIFKSKIVDKCNLDVAAMFRNERRRSLRDPPETKLGPDLFEKEYYNLCLEWP